jgi:sugar lactone lactonase YvrE
VPLPTSPAPTDPKLEPVEEGTVPAPSAEQVQEDIEADERAQDAKERWLESEEAVRQREESRQAFADISASEAEGLLPLFFAEQLAALNADPARLLTDLENVEPLENNAALVSDEQGERSLLESSIPVQSEVGQDSKQPLDLDLERSGDSFTPKNPLAELSLPASAVGSVRLSSGLKFDLPASADSQARLLEDVGLIYPETEKATDTILAPVAGGVEVFQQLRSPDSPEALRFDLDLPPETLLAPTEAGGAEVISASKERIVSIPPPSAVDAQGSPVPVAMSVEGSSLTLEVAHRSRDLAYPILVDPAFIEENAPFGNWGPAWNDQYILWNSPVLGAQAKGGSYSYAANSFGHWVWTTHGGTTYISAAGFGGALFTLPENCVNEAPTNHPHGYAGLFNPSAGTYVGAGLWYGGSSWTYAYWATGGTQGVRQAVFGIGVGASAVKHKCAITFEVAGVSVQQQDPENPTVSTVTGLPGGWFNDAAPFTLNVPVSDPGLGVKGATISGGGAPTQAPELNCAGTAANQCPSSYTFQRTFSAKSLDEGEQKLEVSGKDVLGKKSTTTTLTSKVDRGEPVVNLDGQFAVATDETGTDGEDTTGTDALSLPAYNLEIVASDGTNAKEAKDKRSGVKSIEVLLDEEKTPKEAWTKSSCPESSCAMSETFPLKLNELVALEKHTLHVVVTDFANNQRTRNVEFKYIPATGMKDEYVMHYFPLPDSQGNEAEEEHPRRPELAVNVISGNLVYRELDVDVEGPAVDLEVERFYNSQLPESENTEWGDGWTLGQTPTLEPEEAESPNKATLVRTSGVVQSSVDLPIKVEDEKFDSKLRAVITKEPGGGYEVADASGETDNALVFNANGDVTELRTGGAAKVEYSYEGGDLAEIAVEDPATAGSSVAPLATAEEEERRRTIPSYASSFGTPGTGTGQFKHPADVAVDAKGNLWVVDKANNRIEKFNQAGEFLKAAGSFGSGAGQLNSPSAIAIDSLGYIDVTDTGNNRIAQFGENGEFRSVIGTNVNKTKVESGGTTLEKNRCTVWSGHVCQAGTAGSVEGQISEPIGITTTGGQNMFVVEKANNRVEKFGPLGELLAKFGSSGSGTAQFKEPTAIAYTPAGNGRLWVADTGNNRIQKWTTSYTFSLATGKEGTGSGEFKHPDAIEADVDGNVYVGDSGNSRVQEFDASGNYLAKFGTGGSAVGQLNFSDPAGITVDGKGGIWLTDTENDRIQHWLARNTAPITGTAPVEPNPTAEIDSPNGLVASIEGDQVGERSYDHEGELLTAYSGPGGETDYEYEGGRLTKVTLPNGTWAEIAYEALGRVKSVTVAPLGANAKTTYFNYQDSPSRRTTVTPPAPDPVTTYEIGADGSVLEWWSKVEPPDLDLDGTLADVQARETVNPIDPGVYNLVVDAYSAHGVTSIEIIANNNLLVSEQNCELVPPTECPEEAEDEWITETGSWPPGILYLEAIVTDALGGVSSERFWVNIPYTPPPDPEAEETPTFSETLNFREEHGLDLDLKGNEQAINDRIFDLIGAWNNPHTPAGEVARATTERWGVPLRAVDAAELDWRLVYWEQASSVIPAWVLANASSTFAGFYIDEPAGGKIVVGFTGGQAAASLSALEQTAGLMAGPDRIVAMTPPPAHTLAYLESLRQQVSEAAAGYPSGLVTRTTVDVRSNSVKVGASNVAQAESLLEGSFGQQAPIAVHYQPRRPELKVGRERIGGMVRAGDEILPPVCTASFGAFDRAKKPGSGTPVLRLFALTAGHCVFVGEKIWRRSNPEPTEDEKQDIGFVRRSGYETPGDPAIDVDAAAIRLDSPNFVPRKIFQAEGMPLIDVTSVWSPTMGTNLCFSGRTSKNIIRCGPMLRPPEIYREGSDEELIVCFQEYIWGGDSGSPVWVEGTGVAVGIAVLGYGGPNEPGLTPQEQAEAAEDPEEACATLLIPYPGRNPAASAFDSSDMAPLHLVTRSNAQP